jgi:hypothetical protein
MHEPGQQQGPEDEETRAGEDASISLVSSIGGMAIGFVTAANTIILTKSSWELEGPSIVVSGLFATASTLFAANEWRKFHRWRDEQIAAGK